MPLRHTGGDGTDSDFRHQFDADARGAVGVLQVEDQLRQIFNRIDVVVWRGTDQTHSGRRMTGRGDDLVDLVAWKFATLTGLGALRNFDL